MTNFIVKYRGEEIEVFPYIVHSYNTLTGRNIEGFNRVDDHSFIPKKNCELVLQKEITNASKSEILNNIDGLTDMECRELLKLYLRGELN